MSRLRDRKFKKWEFVMVHGWVMSTSLSEPLFLEGIIGRVRSVTLELLAVELAGEVSEIVTCHPKQCRYVEVVEE